MISSLNESQKHKLYCFNVNFSKLKNFQGLNLKSCAACYMSIGICLDVIADDEMPLVLQVRLSALFIQLVGNVQPMARPIFAEMLTHGVYSSRIGRGFLLVSGEQ